MMITQRNIRRDPCRSLNFNAADGSHTSQTWMPGTSAGSRPPVLPTSSSLSRCSPFFGHLHDLNYALKAMADRGISFDGADQGLLNMYFKNSYNRLSFTYNVTPSANYQYIPAYRHFKSSISMMHFIGNEKPWLQGREASSGEGSYHELTTQWWSVYDRHYKQAVRDEWIR